MFNWIVQPNFSLFVINLHLTVPLTHRFAAV